MMAANPQTFGDATSHMERCHNAPAFYMQEPPARPSLLEHRVSVYFDCFQPRCMR
jgi:hypothetical protein